MILFKDRMRFCCHLLFFFFGGSILHMIFKDILWIQNHFRKRNKNNIVTTGETTEFFAEEDNIYVIKMERI